MERSLAQLRWQCRRGMRELDELLVRYLNNLYSAAQESEKDAFHILLELSDPELAGYLMNQQPPPPDLAHVIENIRRGTEA